MHLKREKNMGEKFFPELQTPGVFPSQNEPPCPADALFPLNPGKIYSQIPAVWIYNYRCTLNFGGEMFGIGFQEILLILLIALIFFGPKKLPDLARSLGKGFAEFKKAADEVKKSFEDVVEEEELKSELKEEMDKLKELGNDIHREVKKEAGDLEKTLDYKEEDDEKADGLGKESSSPDEG